MMALLVLPYLQLAAMMEFSRKCQTGQRFPECTFLCVPASLTPAWLVYEARAKERRSPGNGASQTPGQCKR